MMLMNEKIFLLVLMILNVTCRVVRRAINMDTFNVKDSNTCKPSFYAVWGESNTCKCENFEAYTFMSVFPKGPPKCVKKVSKKYLGCASMETMTSSSLTIKIPDIVRCNPNMLKVEKTFFWNMETVSGIEGGVWNENTQLAKLITVQNGNKMTISGVDVKSWSGQLFKIDYSCTQNSCLLVKVVGEIYYPFDTSTLFPSSTNQPTTTTKKVTTIGKSTTTRKTSEISTQASSSPPSTITRKTTVKSTQASSPPPSTTTRKTTVKSTQASSPPPSTITRKTTVKSTQASSPPPSITTRKTTVKSIQVSSQPQSTSISSTVKSTSISVDKISTTKGIESTSKQEITITDTSTKQAIITLTSSAVYHHEKNTTDEDNGWNTLAIIITGTAVLISLVSIAIAICVCRKRATQKKDHSQVDVPMKNKYVDKTSTNINGYSNHDQMENDTYLSPVDNFAHKKMKSNAGDFNNSGYMDDIGYVPNSTYASVVPTSIDNVYTGLTKNRCETMLSTTSSTCGLITDAGNCYSPLGTFPAESYAGLDSIHENYQPVNQRDVSKNVYSGLNPPSVNEPVYRELDVPSDPVYQGVDSPNIKTQQHSDLPLRSDTAVDNDAYECAYQKNNESFYHELAI